MRNLSNRPFGGTLEDAVAHVEAEYAAGRQPYVKVSGYEVESHCPREPVARRTLLPQFADEVGLGEIVECSGLGLGRQWRVVAVAVGYPGGIRIMHIEEAQPNVEPMR